VHERLAAEDAEKGIPVRFRVIDNLVEVFEVDLDLRFIHVDPAPLTAEVAAVEDGDVNERREIDPFFHSFLKEIHGADAFDPEVPHKLPEVPLVSRLENATGVLEGGDDHGEKDRRKEGGKQRILS
jgi:hypothetical protein